MDAVLPHLKEIALRSVNATNWRGSECLQELWSGYGNIVRCFVEGGECSSVVVKHVRWPQEQDHPRGWNSSLSHQRKLRSYQVETAWYEGYGARCPRSCRVPQCFAIETHEGELFMVLEDLDAAGFSARSIQVDPRVQRPKIEACLRWLASFHALFMGEEPRALWPIGTYWHLATRPDELAALEDGPLKRAAAKIDARLNDCQFRTLVHGDAKIANFCFNPDGDRVAAVDFQYVGGGCGIKDVAYFISSCLDENQAQQYEAPLLDFYFAQLEDALENLGSALDVPALKAEWRELYAVAWTDFYRFLKGWSPGHWKIHRYSEGLAHRVLESL